LCSGGVLARTPASTTSPESAMAPSGPPQVEHVVNLQRHRRWAIRDLLGKVRKVIRILLGKVRKVIRVVTSGAKRLVVRVAPTQIRQVGMNVTLAEAIVALKPDIVHCHDLNTLVAGMLVKKTLGVPVVYDSHELFLERNLSGRSRRIDRLQWGPIERRLIHHCASVSTVAEGICRHLENQYGLNEVVLIRNVQPSEPLPSPTRILSKSLGIDPARPVLLYAGAILRNRGIEHMIEAASVGRDDLAWVVMGYAQDETYMATLKAHAEELGVLGRTIFFHEAVAPGEVVRYCASADVSVIPTQRVCLSYEFEASNKIFHSVMARVPVAMSNHIEKRLLVERYGIGVLFDETDPQSIAETVASLLDDRVAYAAACEACDRASGELNWEHEERKLLAMFEGVSAEVSEVSEVREVRGRETA
jgi:glycosyltransferase involved in cell wall biosynthesis